ncbi:pyridoxamine 5'-phosphate oxidase family protein [Jannaschia sp. LMIT008]|uniref:pyridoxamine 5'-phosphate oxidase family protein n=1 Tax=Jannaschia maritima TaxID=3032585 RepID=UPI0028116091|nr:pyridoxamine 5'-phosphate oxidase family protein [Jannaschia sp. LMIT008]
MTSGWRDLAALDDHVWARLARAVARSDDPWRIVTLGTLDAAGPQMRMVGLRGADREAASVEVHTDARTPKVDELRADSRASLLLWDGGTQEQLRLTLRMEVIPADPIRWAAVPDVARGNYGTTPQPGTALAEPEAYGRDPAIERFAALSGTIVAMDAVWLAGDPHRRAQWRDGTWGWVAP